MEAYEANLKAAHEALVTAKAMLNAASQQTDDRELRDEATALFAITRDSVERIFHARFGWSPRDGNHDG